MTFERYVAISLKDKCKKRCLPDSASIGRKRKLHLFVQGYKERVCKPEKGLWFSSLSTTFIMGQP